MEGKLKKSALDTNQTLKERREEKEMMILLALDYRADLCNQNARRCMLSGYQQAQLHWESEADKAKEAYHDICRKGIIGWLTE